MRNIIKNISGAFFIFLGILWIIANYPLSGIALILFGITLLQKFYKKIHLENIRHIKILLPLVFFILSLILMVYEAPETTNTVDTNMTIEVDNNEKEDTVEKVIEIENITFDTSDTEIDIKETKDLLLKINPTDSDKSKLKFNTSNKEIITIKENNEKKNKEGIYIQIQPHKEGECEIFAISDKIESNHVKIKVIDKDRIESEEKAKEQENAKKEETQVETQSKTIVTSTKKTQGTTANTTKKSTGTSKSTSSSKTTSSKKASTNTTSTTTKGKTVYRTPTGKRYHYISTCGGKNSYVTTLDKAKEAGLTPCQKCAM